MAEKNHKTPETKEAITVRSPLREDLIFSYFLSRPRISLMADSLGVLVIVALIDHLTGYSLRLSILYLFPVLMVTWAVGKTLGIFLALASCLSLAFIDSYNNQSYPREYYFYAGWALKTAAFVAMVWVVSGLKNILENIKSFSRADSLTGLSNKFAFYQMVGAEMERCRRSKRTLSIAYIDLDNFKRVNDRFGHDAGDELLRLVAHTMRRKLRASDVSARLGGDEFAIMLPESSAEACNKTLRMLKIRLMEAMKSKHWSVTFSIGIATFASIPNSIDEMIKQADSLMYAVKRSGKDEIKQEIFGGLE